MTQSQFYDHNEAEKVLLKLCPPASYGPGSGERTFWGYDVVHVGKWLIEAKYSKKNGQGSWVWPMPSEWQLDYSDFLFLLGDRLIKCVDAIQGGRIRWPET
jgi:hypothetical protein